MRLGTDALYSYMPKVYQHISMVKKNSTGKCERKTFSALAVDRRIIVSRVSDETRGFVG
jgi:hypothetical protein